MAPPFPVHPAPFLLPPPVWPAWRWMRMSSTPGSTLPILTLRPRETFSPSLRRVQRSACLASLHLTSTQLCAGLCRATASGRLWDHLTGAAVKYKLVTAVSCWTAVTSCSPVRLSFFSCQTLLGLSCMSWHQRTLMLVQEHRSVLGLND